MTFSNSQHSSILVDENPTQITEVETVVEREGSRARRGTEIDVADFVYQSGTSIAMSDLGNIEDIASMIDREIERVGTGESNK